MIDLIPTRLIRRDFVSTLVHDTKPFKMSKVDENYHFVYLSKNPVKFVPVSKVNNAFFDESNKQVSFSSYF